MKKLLSFLFVILAAVSFAENVLKELYLPADDGVKIHTYVLLPSENGKYPVIVRRTPYAKTTPEVIAAEEKSMRNRNLRGYAYVFQNCRGTGRSEGDFIPYVDERADGLSLLKWIRKQSFYNGEIYLAGASYSATVHGSLLNTCPPDVKGIVWNVQDTERYNIIYRNGFLRLRLHTGWYMGVYKKNTALKRDKKEAYYKKFPLSGITSRVFGERAADYEEALLHPDKNDPFWKTPGFGGAEYSDALVNCKIPILFIGSWHDIYAGGMVDIWRKLAPEHRKKCVFIITPFDHSYAKRPANIAPELFSPGGQISEFVPIRRGLPEYWFDHLRLGTPLEYLTKGEVNRYVLFGDRWVSSPEIGSSSKYCKFYLNTDRTLSATPAQSGKISYKYDPRDPAVFQGACHGNFGGVALQGQPNSRQDIISFVSAPFEEDKTVEGDFKGRLYVTSTAPDSCFYIRLSVVKGDRAFGLRNEIDSICRTNPDFVPGKEAAIDFSIAPHHFKVAKGDRLRLDISSSCFPYFQLHSNFRGNQALQTGTQVADNTLFTGKSYIEIPFAPERKSK